MVLRSLLDERPVHAPGDIVVPDQFFDRTKGRISTFLGNGIVGHVAFAHPLCHDLSTIAADSASKTSPS